MTLGGFTAKARITKSQISGGFTKEGIPYTSASMELEGTLLRFYYKDLKERITQDTKTKVYVSIEFTEAQETTDRYEGDDKYYIGIIGLSDYTKQERIINDGTEIVANVNITLPIKIFPRLYMMEGKPIVLITIHDIIGNPTKEQKEDGIVAFVKRVYFEKVSEKPENHNL